MTTSRIYAYRWPARLVSHKPFAAESYSITPSCIWQVFFRKKNEFSFLFSPFCQRAHFLCKMHNPQAFLPVENSAVPAAQCLVWAIRARVIPIIQGNPLSHRCAMPAPPKGELYLRWREGFRVKCKVCGRAEAFPRRGKAARSAG